MLGFGRSRVWRVVIACLVVWQLEGVPVPVHAAQNYGSCDTTNTIWRTLLQTFVAVGAYFGSSVDVVNLTGLCAFFQGTTSTTAEIDWYLGLVKQATNTGTAIDLTNTEAQQALFQMGPYLLNQWTPQTIGGVAGHQIINPSRGAGFLVPTDGSNSHASTYPKVSIAEIPGYQGIDLTFKSAEPGTLNLDGTCNYSLYQVSGTINEPHSLTATPVSFGVGSNYCYADVYDTSQAGSGITSSIWVADLATWVGGSVPIVFFVDAYTGWLTANPTIVTPAGAWSDVYGKTQASCESHSVYWCQPWTSTVFASTPTPEPATATMTMTVVPATATAVAGLTATATAAIGLTSVAAQTASAGQTATAQAIFIAEATEQALVVSEMSGYGTVVAGQATADAGYAQATVVSATTSTAVALATSGAVATVAANPTAVAATATAVAGGAQLGGSGGYVCGDFSSLVGGIYSVYCGVIGLPRAVAGLFVPTTDVGAEVATWVGASSTRFPVAALSLVGTCVSGIFSAATVNLVISLPMLGLGTATLTVVPGAVGTFTRTLSRIGLVALVLGYIWSLRRRFLGLGGSE